MKIALVLDVDSPKLLQHSQEIDRLLLESNAEFEQTVLWLFYRRDKPVTLPLFHSTIDKVYWLNIPEIILAETCLPLLLQVHQAYCADVLLFDSSSLGNELATRLAYRLGGASCLGVIKGIMVNDSCLVEKLSYGNKMIATLSLLRRPYCLAAARQGSTEAKTVLFQGVQVDVDIPEPEPPLWLVSAKVSPVVDELALSRAKNVLAIGQGAASKQNVLRLTEIAQHLGAQLGTSRPVVMSAWSSMQTMLGMSGTLVSPEVCIVAGVSGAAAFSMGIKQSKFVVAINTDPQAAIFAQADVGIVDDMFPVLEELAQCIEQRNQEVAKKCL